jgi:DNA-binding CsgD family transcriptional regulator
VSIEVSPPGIVLLDSGLNPVAYNAEAIRILTFPSRPDRIKQLRTFLADRIRSSLVDRQSSSELSFVKGYKSGAREYSCRSFRLENNNNGGAQTILALLFERHTSGAAALAQISEAFELTNRECEAVGLLVQGLTSKEIATRMNISPNTVKAFLRLVMVKMGVSTRSGIVGKVVGGVAS